MVEFSASELPVLVEGVLIWTGWGSRAWPCRDYEALVQHFGTDAASKLCQKINLLEEEFYSSNAWHVATNHQEMARLAAEHFKEIWPEAPNQIVQAFTWCYTYDYK